jgi:hypothetical protein
MKNLLKMLGIIALVVVIGFSMAFTACDMNEDEEDRLPRDHMAYDTFGTWRTTGSSWWQIEITDKKVKLSSSRGNYMILGNLTWEEIINDGTLEYSPSISEYPSGFSYTGKITENKGVYGDEYSTGTENIMITRQIYLNNSKTRLYYSGRPDDTFSKR